MNRFLDRLIGRVTMYKLVINLLAVTALVSFGLSFAGALAYTPIQLLASLLVAVGVTLLTSWAIALPFRARFHLDSALVTGLLVFFVLLPSTEAKDLAVSALAAAVASVSKFVVAWRGRHIFNPAAFGAFVVTVFGLAFSGWWIATPYLFPVVLITSFLVLWRTRKLTMGLVFVVVSVVILLARYLPAGTDVATALETAFLSLPTVFFAGFMLSEPLTLPPRRWQQLVVAVVAAALFSIPFHLGPVYASPQLALLVGNVVGFAFGQRRGLALEFRGRRRLSPSTWEFSFQPLHHVTFAPGQFMELHLPHKAVDWKGSRRVFSISSAPGPDAPITFAMRIDDKPSSFKRALLELEPGARARGTGVGGDFTLPSDASQPLLLVAGGIGITPFTSQLAHADSAARDVVVVYSVGDPSDLAYSDVLESAGVRVVVVAPVAPDVLPRGWVFGGPGRISRELLAASVPDIARRRAYVSGPPRLVSDVRSMLRSLGAKRIVTDAFSGY